MNEVFFKGGILPAITESKNKGILFLVFVQSKKGVPKKRKNKSK